MVCFPHARGPGPRACRMMAAEIQEIPMLIMHGDSPRENCIAYIDGANLHKGVESLGWKLDYRHFRSWLRQKFGVADAVIFLGLIPKNAPLYSALQSYWYRLVFKEVIYDGDGKAKGNCDSDLVLAATRDFYENQVSSVVLVSSDGDYAPLVSFWKAKAVSCSIVSPAPVEKCSILLKRLGVPIVYLGDMRGKLALARS